MAKGYPDFFGFSFFPFFGQLLLDSGTKVMSPGDPQYYGTDFQFRGTVVEGFITAVPASVADQWAIEIIVGESILQYINEDSFNDNTYFRRTIHLEPVRISTETNSQIWRIKSQIQFKDYFKVRFTLNAGASGDCTFTSTVSYYKIQT